VKIDPFTTWQPNRGQVKFTIEGTGLALDNSNIIVCFRWSQTTRGEAQEGKKLEWVQSPLVKIIETGVAGKVGFVATVPDDIPGAEPWWRHIKHSGNRVHYGSWSTVPQADFRVMVSSSAPWSALDLVLSLGITSVYFALLIAAAFVAVALAAIYVFATRRGVPGESIGLKIISTSRGYASLSQAQIILWTFLVGAGAIYVMALSGNLIDISSGTLIVLGITGAATVGAKLQSAQEAQAAATAPAPVPSPPPGPVTGLAPNGQVGETDVSLSWAPPAGGGRPSTYMVQYSLRGVGAWTYGKRHDNESPPSCCSTSRRVRRMIYRYSRRMHRGVALHRRSPKSRRLFSPPCLRLLIRLLAWSQA
jgi:hypothetical protein